MLKTKKKFILGRGPIKRSKMRWPVRLAAVCALLFIPWQAYVLTQTSDVTARVKHKLLGVSVTVGDTGPAPAPELRNLADPLHDYGIAIGPDVLQLDDAALQKRLAAMQAVGIGWVRVPIAWQDVQPRGPNDYTWTAYDRVIRALGKYQFKMIATLYSAPVWAKGACSAACPFANANQFAAFAARAATHYQPMGVQIWEVWSEPNTAASWQAQPDAIAYAKLLQATYPAIRQANPQAIVITGGLSPHPTDDDHIAEIEYLPQLYAAGAKGYFDAVGAHPYTYPFIPSHNSQQGWSRMSQTANNLRQTMIANGDAVKKIWITDFGAPTSGTGAAATMENHRTQDATHVDEEVQAQIITKAAELYRGYDWTGPLIWTTYADPGVVLPTGEQDFGIVHADGSKKPAYAAIQAALASQ
ncbi:MAG TPA: cellulase family glycosylhydrolase [Candidatus Saccharimonadales bacterium]|nr:cellulase family glycosylhydrolase [Candidatus Saccharimonadales bacterium]